jgi:peroxiredoxin
MKRIAIAALTLAALLPAAAFAMARVGAQAAPFSLATIDGKTLTMAALKGKPVYLNFYATWCPPCNDEAPAIEKLAQKYRGRVQVIGVNELESPAKAKSFFDKYHLTYPAVVDADGSLGRDYRSMIGLPIHVFIDRSGVVKLMRNGEMSPADIEAAFKSLL